MSQRARRLVDGKCPDVPACVGGRLAGTPSGVTNLRGLACPGLPHDAAKRRPKVGRLAASPRQASPLLLGR
jgi:hypothetical protein